MKRFQNYLMNKLQIPMTAEQETDFYTYLCETNFMPKKFFLWIIIAFQLYNIGYTLFYTKGRLHTVPSRVYTTLYVLLLLASLVTFFLVNHFKKHLPKNTSKIFQIQFIYAIILFAWSACVTIYDQRVSENISTYLIMSLSIAILVYFKPLQAIFTYSFFCAILCWLLPLFKDPSKDSYSEYVHLIILTVMCILINIYRDYLERRNYLQQQEIKEKTTYLEELVNQDPLTKLHNRRFLETKMPPLFQQYLDQKIPVTFMMLDIDAFKDYNDRFGHRQGDECLRRVSWRIQKELDENKEYLIRYGGEEFLYIGFGIDRQTAQNKGKYFNQIIRNLVIGHVDQDPMGVTISVGLYTAAWDQSAQHLAWTDCINQADKALYMAKESGKDRIVCLSK